MKWKHIIGDVEVNRDLVLLLLIGGLYTLAISLSNTFVNIYLWKQTQNYVNLGLYNLASVVLQPLTFLVGGKLAKRIDRSIFVRIGVGTLAIFFIVVLVAGKSASQYILLMGALLGVGYGFYWLAFNLLTFEITEPETRDFFNGFSWTCYILLWNDWTNSSRIHNFTYGEMEWLYCYILSFISSICNCCRLKLLFI